MINRRRSGARGTPAKVNVTAGLAAGEGVNSTSVSDGSHERVSFRPQPELTPGLGKPAPAAPTTLSWTGRGRSLRAIGVDAGMARAVDIGPVYRKSERNGNIAKTQHVHRAF